VSDAASHRVTRWLARAGAGPFAIYAVATAFTTYFAMYSFRKPFAAAHFSGLTFASIELKSAMVISQLCGYALAKCLGIKFNSEMKPGRRAWALVFLIGWAELALVLFAVLPPSGKVFALFLNGLPLGAVWGVVFSFLEGRRTSEILGAGLSCAYVLASGAVKSVGSSLLVAGVTEAWMPALTGLMFLPVFLVAVYGLSLIPPPSPADVAARTEREPMSKTERRQFLRQFLPGLVLLVIVYLFLTSYRDFRDNYAAEIWADLGADQQSRLFTLSEIPIAISVMVALGLLFLVKNNRRGLLLTYLIMIAGSVLIGAATLLFDLGALSPLQWMILVGLGLYLGYVPYGCVLFDRTIAALGIVATAVFLIYVSDAVAYSGSVALQLYKTLGQAAVSKLVFFRYFSYATSIACTLFFSIACVYFFHRARRSKPESSATVGAGTAYSVQTNAAD
jgi:MFS family permease